MTTAASNTKGGNGNARGPIETDNTPAA
jgi:hypothetical protein